MRLVGEAVGKDGHIVAVCVVLKRLNGILVLCDMALAHEALDGLVGRGLHDDLRALGDLGDEGAAVAVDQVVALAGIGRRGEAGGVERYGGQRVEHHAGLIVVLEAKAIWATDSKGAEGAANIGLARPESP